MDNSLEVQSQRLMYIYESLLHRGFFDSKSEFAEFLQYNRSYVTEILNGKKKISPLFAASVKEKMGVDPNWLRFGQGLPPDIDEVSIMIVNQKMNQMRSNIKSNAFGALEQAVKIDNKSEQAHQFNRFDFVFSDGYFNKYTKLSNDQYLLEMPILNFRSTAMLLNFESESDGEEYFSRLQKHCLVLDRINENDKYYAFEVLARWETEVNIDKIIRVGLEIDRKLWASSHYIMFAGEEWLILTKEGVRVARVVGVNKEDQKIQFSTYNPFEDRHEDFYESFENIVQMFAVETVTKFY